MEGPFPSTVEIRSSEVLLIWRWLVVEGVFHWVRLDALGGGSLVVVACSHLGEGRPSMTEGTGLLFGSLRGVALVHMSFEGFISACK